ncbi:MAG: sigma-70 family RNA polymerase sigma factor [Clostridia bacterium]|nr:sigma-70 family RNA polymerase sigma factor [Clostridia bacterium]
MLFFTFDSERELKIERLYHSYKKLLYKVAFDILQDGALSEDAVHDTFLRVMKNLNKIDEENCPRTRNFLVVICRNVALNMKTKYIADCELQDNMQSSQESVESIIAGQDALEKLTDIINTLDPIYRDVFILRRVHKLSRHEIAKIMNLSTETVKKRLTRAREQIEEKAKKEGII